MPFTLSRTRRPSSSRSIVDVVKSKIHASQKRDPNATCDTHLPAEILSYIFILASETDPTFPVTASHVCRAWRELALHTPSLWRHINLDGRIRLWTEFVRRAKTCTLDIQLSSNNNIPTHLHSTSPLRTYRRHYLDAQSAQWYMHSMIPYISRWRSLSIDFHHYAPYLWNAALTPCCGYTHTVHAPYLEKLVLIHPYNEDTKEFTLFGGYTPYLRSVIVHGVRLTWLPSLFGNLTMLDYTHHGFTRGHDAASELLFMVQISSRLKDLRLSFPSNMKNAPRLSPASYTFPEPFPKETSYLLRDLQSLTLKIPGTEIASALIHFIAHISVPNLRILRLISTTTMNDITCSSSSSLPRIYPNRLTHAHHAPPGPETSSRLRQILKALPRLSVLHTLEVENGWLTDPRFIYSFLHMLPRLRHLILRGPCISNLFMLDLSEVLRARVAKMYGIDVVELDHCDGISGETLVEAVKRRLAGRPGEMRCVRSIHVKDCAGVDPRRLRKLKSFDVSIRVWQKDSEVQCRR
ncbi:hypothetical protein C8Q75DRAFT_146526 [Abortiporus biennis]|nr:hypothetical protein C8Q75DRAFT_146526 [Abortiporus biennis]